MAFHNVEFSRNVAYGARGRPQFNTTIMELSSGHEKRNQNWAKARCRYSIALSNRSPAQMNDVQAFFYARAGRANTFLFYDHKDHLITNQQIGTGDGAETAFQIFKRYSSGGYTYDRTITKIVPSTIGDVMVGGLPNTDYTLDVATGIITFDTAPAAAAPVIVTSVEFYVHARFDTDFLDIQLNNFEVETWQDIMIIEVKEGATV